MSILKTITIIILVILMTVDFAVLIYSGVQIGKVMDEVFLKNKNKQIKENVSK
jgi:uncharacterized protein YxeA